MCHVPGGRQRPSLWPALCRGCPARPQVARRVRLCPPHSPAGPGAAPGLTLPTRLMAQVKQWLAMAAFLASIGHMDSL